MSRGRIVPGVALKQGEKDLSTLPLEEEQADQLVDFAFMSGRAARLQARPRVFPVSAAPYGSRAFALWHVKRCTSDKRAIRMRNPVLCIDAARPFLA